MDRRRHWEAVYGSRPPDAMSWFQREAPLSGRIIGEALPDPGARILDVGGGASTLVDDLLDRGYRRVGVLDISAGALAHSRARLGERARRVRWFVGDVLRTPLGRGTVDLWHDRAVFHFLTEAADRERYVDEVRRVVRPGGLVLVATFAADGPERCSGLPVARYDPEALHAAFDGGFELLSSRREVHHTPAGAPQPFTYCLCRRAPDPGRAET